MPDRWLLLALLLPMLGGSALAADRSVDFVRDVRPIFERHCYACHGPHKQRSGLRLDQKRGAFRGGDGYGASVVPHQPAESPLLQFVTSTDPDERMPPEGDRLPAADIEILRRWIAEGAVWPDGIDLLPAQDPREHWSLQPLAVPPKSRSLDEFIVERLAEHGLTLSPEVDRRTWHRRVALDLTGLPPTPDEVQAFVHDPAPDAYERVVDRLLSSPRYGERWAQHWLDVVRYADTHGFEVNTERPNAWPYRDYVIQAFNADTPYDQFIREQIAGDALGQDAATGFLVTASVLLPGQIGQDEPSKRLARQDAIDEIVVNIGQTFLGLSLGCARCHDHKFDPITLQDYYAFQAFVAGVEYEEREVHSPEREAARQRQAALQARLTSLDHQLARLVPVARSGVRRPMINARQNVERFPAVAAKRIRFTIRATNRLEPCLDELEVFAPDGVNVALAAAGAAVTASGSTTVADRHELKHVNDGEYGNSRSWMSDQTGQGWVVIEFPREQVIERVVWGRDRQAQFVDRLATDYVLEAATDKGPWQVLADATDRIPFDPAAAPSQDSVPDGLNAEETAAAQALLDERRVVAATIGELAAAQKIFAGTFRQPDPIRVLRRGDPEQPLELVSPAIPAVFQPLPTPADSSADGECPADRDPSRPVSQGSPPLPLAIDAPEPARRLTLAEWIASPQHPLTARVMVNRIWQGHFGTGIVATSNDFGTNGLPPSHPELLDWLAGEFIRSGWSIKQLHRRIVLSRTYRQSSVPHPLGNERDAEVRLLWRYPTRRLEAEAIRDSMLAVSGRLQSTMYGRGFDLFDKRGGLSGFQPVESFSRHGLRRMIYAHKVRRERDAVFGAFDCPDGGQSSPRRRESTTPLQSLNLFNSRFTHEEAGAFADRVRNTVGDDVQRQIEVAYQLALNREPHPSEVHDARTVVLEHGLATLARVLFNSNEFLFFP